MKLSGFGKSVFLLFPRYLPSAHRGREWFANEYPSHFRAEKHCNTNDKKPLLTYRGSGLCRLVFVFRDNENHRHSCQFPFHNPLAVANNLLPVAVQMTMTKHLKIRQGKIVYYSSSIFIFYKYIIFLCIAVCLHKQQHSFKGIIFSFQYS